MKHSAEYYIEHLEMEPHVEGGYFKKNACWKRREEPVEQHLFYAGKGEVSHFSSPGSRMRYGIIMTAMR